MARSIRGLEQEQEQNQQRLLRDTRTTGQRIGDFLKNPGLVAVFLLIIVLAEFFLPGLVDFLFIFADR